MARRHDFGCDAAIYLLRPGAATRVRTWTPLEGPFHGFLVTHNESISIADYLTLREDGAVRYRPTVHYAYHPCDDAVLSLHEFAGKNWQLQEQQRLMMHEIVHGIDELGVLLMGHAQGRLLVRLAADDRAGAALAPHNNATSLQVTAAVLGGLIWAIENPRAGIVEADQHRSRARAGDGAALSGRPGRRLQRLDAAAGSGALFPGGYRSLPIPGSSRTSASSEAADARMTTRCVVVAGASSPIACIDVAYAIDLPKAEAVWARRARSASTRARLNTTPAKAMAFGVPPVEFALEPVALRLDGASDGRRHSPALRFRRAHPRAAAAVRRAALAASLPPWWTRWTAGSERRRQ